MSYRPTIGLEIHAELKTRTKMFCDSLNDPDERHPNTNVCPVCMGHPGTLPVPNKKAIEKLLQVGLALNCSISKNTFFERKNYFYPDLPKGYQISQFQKPFCRNGYLDIGNKKIRIERIHLEEDAGRLQHGKDGSYTLIDFNRAGVPLLELVTEPDLTSGEEVRKFAEELQLILRYLNASDADMEKGQMRVEVNVSISKTKKLGTKVEVKNLNSIRIAALAVEYETKRQSQVLERRGKILQETRGWNDEKRRTFGQRSKEESHDYRYFPEPDIPPIKVEFGIRNNTSKGSLIIDLEKIKSAIPELPRQRRERFKKEYFLPKGDYEIFVANKKLGDYFEKVVSELLSWEKLAHLKKPGKEHEKRLIKLTANYLITEIIKIQREKIGSSDLRLVNWDSFNITPENFAEFIVRVHTGEVSSTGAQTLLREMYETGAEPKHIIDKKNLAQISDITELNIAMEKVLSANRKAVEDYKKGKKQSLKFLIGQIMRETKGKANPKTAEKLILKSIR